MTGTLVLWVLCAAAVTTAISQEKPNLVDMDALAARGAILVDQDPMALELRSQQWGELAQKAFDIGMGAADGHTAQGPGKDRTCLRSGEPAACALAVQFSVDRNKYANLDKRGRAIAKADPAIAAAAGNAFRDILYRLGFYIGLATAEGQTLEGPGKEKTCASLSSSASQTGCRTAVTFSIERNRNTAALLATKGTRANPWEMAKAEKAPSNEIRCRGGSPSRDPHSLTFIAENTKRASTGETLIVTLLQFEPSAYAAGERGEGLRPGECSWADRPINGIFLIRFETPANAQLKQKLQGTKVDTSPTAAETYPDARSIQDYLYDSNHYWRFFGGPPVNNFLTATGHGHWKPAIAIGDVVRSPTETARPKRVLFPPKP